MTRTQAQGLIRAFPLFAVLLPAAVLAACSESGGGGGGGGGGEGAQCKPYVVPSGTDLTKPTVSFNSQVVPIFQRYCSSNQAECHQAQEKPVLGLLGDGSDPAEIKTRLVNVPSSRLPRMPYVTPGDPENSFLMRTMDGDQCMFNDECRSGFCGDRMPFGETQLISVQERDIIRRWIAQGAK